MALEIEDIVIIGLLLGLGALVAENAANSPTGSGEGGILQPFTDAAVKAFAEAIATAEGFYNGDPNSIPRRANNPGDVTMGDVPAGVLTNGTLGAAGIAVFLTLEDGWTALYTKIHRILSGNSHIYNPDMTISEMAAKYTTTEQAAWAHNVAGTLGVTPDTTLNDVAALHG